MSVRPAVTPEQRAYVLERTAFWRRRRCIMAKANQCHTLLGADMFVVMRYHGRVFQYTSDPAFHPTPQELSMTYPVPRLYTPADFEPRPAPPVRGVALRSSAQRWVEEERVYYGPVDHPIHQVAMEQQQEPLGQQAPSQFFVHQENVHHQGTHLGNVGIHPVEGVSQETLDDDTMTNSTQSGNTEHTDVMDDIDHSDNVGDTTMAQRPHGIGSRPLVADRAHGPLLSTNGFDAQSSPESPVALASHTPPSRVLGRRRYAPPSVARSRGARRVLNGARHETLESLDGTQRRALPMSVHPNLGPHPSGGERLAQPSSSAGRPQQYDQRRLEVTFGPQLGEIAGTGRNGVHNTAGRGPRGGQTEERNVFE